MRPVSCRRSRTFAWTANRRCAPGAVDTKTDVESIHYPKTGRTHLTGLTRPATVLKIRRTLGTRMQGVPAAKRGDCFGDRPDHLFIDFA